MSKYILVSDGKVQAVSNDLDILVKKMMFFKIHGLEAAVYRLVATVQIDEEV